MGWRPAVASGRDMKFQLILKWPLYHDRSQMSRRNQTPRNEPMVTLPSIGTRAVGK